MDRDILEDKSLLIDLESGRLNSEEGTRQDLCTSDQQTRIMENGPINCSLGTNSYLEVIVREENDESLVEKYEKKKNKKNNNKKALKPPRPPKGPSLDAADMMFVKEISAHVMNRRAKIERIKALRKMREEKSYSSSSKSSICAMIFTVIFILVICFQGFCSKGVNNVNSHGSPEPAADGLISVQFFNNPSANDGTDPGSSSSPEEHTLGSNFPGSVASTAV